MQKMERKHQQILVASEVEISEQKKNDIFIEIDLCICTTLPNVNRKAVTEEFIDEIVDNPDIYNGIPLYCDKENLLAGNYDRLGHKWNRLTGEYFTDMIGSLWDFSKDQQDGVTRLLATAKVPKRDYKVCERLVDMYELDLLCFSFEVTYRLSRTKVNNGIRIVGADDHNFLFGVTVVSRPAFKDAVSLNMVAEQLDDATEKEVQGPMKDLENTLDMNAEMNEPGSENDPGTANVELASQQEPDVNENANQNEEPQVDNAEQQPEPDNAGAEAGQVENASAENLTGNESTDQQVSNAEQKDEPDAKDDGDKPDDDETQNTNASVEESRAAAVASGNPDLDAAH